MTWEALLTLVVVVAVVAALVWDVAVPAAVMLAGVVVLLVADVVTPAQALTGFGNPAPATVAALYVVAAGLERTGLVHRLVDRMMYGAGSERATLARLVLPAAGASSIVNNTPIVAMAAPAVGRWADTAERPASRLLMPLSFAAILGGMVTVVGTSTHIVVSGLLESVGLEPFGFFEVSRLGLPIAVVGLVVLVALAPVLLPERRSARRDIDDSREYTVEMVVDPGGPIDGLTVEQASLRHLAGVFLIQIERDGDVVGAVGPTDVLLGGDVLRFVGNARKAADLHDRRGLTAVAARPGVIPQGPMAFFEAVVGVGSALVGRSLRDIGFRDRYHAAVVAIHRADQRVLAKLGDVRLRVGDTLLVLAQPSFRERWRGSGDFILVARLDSVDPYRSTKAGWAAVIGAATITAAASGVVTILEAALVGAFAMVVFGVLTPGEARRSVDVNVVVLIAASFGLGVAIQETGLAADVAHALVSGAGRWGTGAVVVAIAAVTILLTEAVTNNGAAVLVFPVALAIAAESGIDPRLAAITVSVAASASFLTPIGYQTNTMVWGPGGYRFVDYARLGAPLTAVTLVVVALVGG
jgi:di/tricarboxylate transporter